MRKRKEKKEGEKNWLKEKNELRNGGEEDDLNAEDDGLKGYPEAITTALPLASVQTCNEQLSRYCLSKSGRKKPQAIARELKATSRAKTPRPLPNG